MFFGTADRLLEGARGYQIDSQKANNICEIITYEGQGHGFFNMGEYYNLILHAELLEKKIDLIKMENKKAK